MFTGIIETIGVIRRLERHQQSVVLGIEPQLEDFEVAIGGSVAVNGACLTMEKVTGATRHFRAVAETLSRTNLGALAIGDRVNLERSVPLGGRLEGHFVLGHVDATATIAADRTVGDSLVRTFRVPPALAPFLAPKGSIAVDGISLTIVASDGESFSVSFIPHTLQQTTMPSKKTGQAVNIECDVLARYIFQLLRTGRPDASAPQTDSPAPSADASLLEKLERYSF
jgi:riboflavin synthase